MSIEDDHEHLGEQMKRAMASITATQPDPLVFLLRGAEIRDRLIKLAETAEAEAAKITAVVAHSRDREREPTWRLRQVGHQSPPLALPALPAPPGYEPLSAEAQMHMSETMAKTYLRTAEDFRFMAAHVDEDRIFRLATHDMQCLGFTFGSVITGGPIGYR